MMNTIQFCGIEFVAKPRESASPALLAEEIINPDINMILEETTKSDCQDTSILPPPTTPNNRKKFPRLNELYGKLFDTPLPKDMHNSIVDVLVCLRCFLKVRGVKEMTEDYFLGLIQKHSRDD